MEKTWIEKAKARFVATPPTEQAFYLKQLYECLHAYVDDLQLPLTHHDECIAWLEDLVKIRPELNDWAKKIVDYLKTVKTV